MDNSELTVILALGSNLLFSSATLIFANYSRHVSVLWMNTVKALIAITFFFLSTLIFSQFHPISNTSLILLLLSGALGLGVGDLFLFSAFKSIGPGRTLIFYGMEPVILGIFGFFLFGQELNPQKFWGIFFFLICFFIFSIESRKTKGSWEIKGLLMAFTGVAFDAVGILLTRMAFEATSGLESFEVNFYRFAAALFVFFLISRFYRPIHLIEKFKRLSWRQRTYVFVGCFMGTFLALLLYLRAIKTGHLATVSGIAITSPLFATLLECVIAKKWPSKYLWFALASFVVGFVIVLR